MVIGTNGNDDLQNDPAVAGDIVDALAGDDRIQLVPSLGPMTAPDVTVHGGLGFDTIIASSGSRWSATTSDPSGFSGTLTSIYGGLYPSYRGFVYDSIERINVTGIYAGGWTTGASQDILHFTVDLRASQSSVGIRTNGGDDEIYLGGYTPQSVEIDAGAGNDIINFDFSFRQGVSIFISAAGGEGDDTISGSIYADSISGGAGNDVIFGRGGADIIDAGSGDDVITSSNGVIFGGDGDDVANFGGLYASYSISTSAEGLNVDRASDATSVKLNGVERLLFEDGTLTVATGVFKYYVSQPSIASGMGPVTNDSTPSLTGTADPGNRVSIFDGSALLAIVTADASGTWNYTSASPLADGAHNFSATATDAQGRTGVTSAVLAVTIDTIPPAQPTIILDVSSNSGSTADGITNDSTPLIRGAAEANSHVTILDGSTVLAVVTAAADGSWSFTTAALTDGSHSLSAQATDAAGNVSPLSSGLSIVIDTALPDAPAAPILDDSSNSGSVTDRVTNDNTPLIRGTALAGGLVTVLDGSVIIGTTTAAANGVWSFTTPTLSDGTHLLSVRVTDTAGNIGPQSSALPVVLDTVAPLASATPVLDPSSNSGSTADAFTIDTTPLIRGTAEAGSLLTIFDGATVLGTATATSDGSWSYTTPRLSTGSHSLHIVATDIAGNVGQTSPSLSIAIDTSVRNDFNGDGRSDLVWLHTSGAFAGWLGQADGSFLHSGRAANPVDPTWSIVGSGDVNGDGLDDLIWRHSSGALAEWLGKADGSFANNGAAAVTIDPSWRVAGTGDFNGDGRADIVWLHTSGAFAGWLGQADGTFLHSGKAANPVDISWNIVATGDFNGDGRADLLWRHTGGTLAEWIGQSDGSFTNNEAAATFLAQSWSVLGAGDFDGDGRDDLVLRDNTGNISTWLGQSNGGFAVSGATSMLSPGPDWHVAGIGDYNGDGHDDLVWRSSSGQLSEWSGQYNGEFAYNPHVSTLVDPSWKIQSPDILLS